MPFSFHCMKLHHMTFIWNSFFKIYNKFSIHRRFEFYFVGFQFEIIQMSFKTQIELDIFEISKNVNISSLYSIRELKQLPLYAIHF